MAQIKATCTELAMDPSAPWRNTMRFSSDEGDATLPYDESFNLGDVVVITVEKETKK